MPAHLCQLPGARHRDGLPRGRIHTLKAIAAGELELDAAVAPHFDSCLGCFACVSACPAGVRYDQLIEQVRPQLNKAELRSPWQQQLRRLLLGVILPATAARPAATFSALCRWTAAALGSPQRPGEALRPGSCRDGAAPTGTAFRRLWPDPQGVLPATGTKRARVGLVLGCVQRVFDPAVNHATIAVLQANGVEVVLPASQGCCGGQPSPRELEQTRDLARDLVKQFEGEPLDAVLVAASGCGHTLKQYGELLPGEAGFSAPCWMCMSSSASSA